MGLIDAIPGRRVYLDANVFIYVFEEFPGFERELKALFQRFDRRELEGVTSELTLGEILVRPFLRNSLEKAKACQSAIVDSDSVQAIPVSRGILVEAARLGARAGLRLPDAIHLAATLQERCDVFLTNDKQPSRVVEIPVVLLSESAHP